MLSFDCAPVAALLPELGIPQEGRLSFFYFDGAYDDFESTVGTWDPSASRGSRVLHLHPELSTRANIANAATPAPPGLTPFPVVPLTAVKTLTWPSSDTHTDDRRGSPMQLSLTCEVGEDAYVEVEVAHFVDAGEKDADGRYDYYYEGDTYTFSEDEQHIEVRTYVDDATSAFFIGMSYRQVRDSTLAREAAEYLASTGRTALLCLGPSGTYEAWVPKP